VWLSPAMIHLMRMRETKEASQQERRQRSDDDVSTAKPRRRGRAKGKRHSLADESVTMRCAAHEALPRVARSFVPVVRFPEGMSTCQRFTALNLIFSTLKLLLFSPYVISQ
jgi:hypothetical protein